MDVTAIIVAVISAAGIPTALTGLLIRRLEKKMDKKEKAREKAEHKRQENELLIIKGIGASLALSEATAAAVQRIPDAHCNGDMHAALEYARKIKHKHKDFLYEEAINHIVD